MKHDRQIQQEVINELENDDGVTTSDIGVEVHHGVVKLAGRTTDPVLRKSAERAARRVPGVRSVVLDMDTVTHKV